MRKVFVTGVSGGIGSACAAQLAAEGWEVIGFDRSMGQDACNPADVAAALAGIDRLDGVVHAAGIVGVGGIEDQTLESWHSVMDANLTSAFVVCQAVDALLADGSSVVLFSSVNGRHGGNRLSGPAYATAKAGILGLMKHLAKDKGPRGIRYNAVAPGPVATQMLERLDGATRDRLRATMPLGREITAAQVAGTVSYLLSDAAGATTGTTIDLGGIYMG